MILVTVIWSLVTWNGLPQDRMILLKGCINIQLYFHEWLHKRIPNVLVLNKNNRLCLSSIGKNALILLSRFPGSPVPRFPCSPVPRFPCSPVPRFPGSPFPILKIAKSNTSPLYSEFAVTWSGPSRWPPLGEAKYTQEAANSNTFKKKWVSIVNNGLISLFFTRHLPIRRYNMAGAALKRLMAEYKRKKNTFYLMFCPYFMAWSINHEKFSITIYIYLQNWPWIPPKE